MSTANIFMMCKNEADLLIPWGIYHGEIFGYKNITIIDNGTDDPKAIIALEKIEAMGANVIRHFNKPEHFIAKGEIINKLISDAERDNPTDFYFPLDCDEFIGACINEELFFDLENINFVLAPYKNDSRVLMIGRAYDNHPILHGYFRPSNDQRKCFFAHSTCYILDHGFHVGESKAGNIRVKTNIVYMHYHYKPYNIIVDHARAKLRPFLPDIDHRELNSIPKDIAGSHLLGHLQHESAEEYYSSFGDENYMYIPQFGCTLSLLGQSLPFYNGERCPEGFNPEKYLLVNKDIRNAGQSATSHYLRHGRFEGRQWF
jgi:hypothetical protein